MKFLSILVAVATLAAKVSGHCMLFAISFLELETKSLVDILPELIVGGVNTSAWQYVR
jgi:hypothetical protein